MTEEKKRFKYTEYHAPQNRATDVDLVSLYEQANAELGLQQSKRDQIITIYLTMFSFLLPFSISIKEVGWQVKGFIFLAAAVIGVLFAFVILRYRIYKEVYWLCCQSITVMMGHDKKDLTKEKVQEIYYHVMDKKNGGYVDGEDENRTFNKKQYAKDNFVSAETLHYLIHVFITATLTGLSAGMISGQPVPVAVAIGVVVFAAVMLWLMWMYFHDLIKVYDVLVDRLDQSFNRTFGKAWFLHLF